MSMMGEQTARIAFLMQRIPENAVLFRVVSAHIGGAQTICEYTKQEIEGHQEEVAKRIVSSCDTWLSSGEKVFVGHWLGDGGRILDSIKFRMNPDNGMNNANAPNWDGSPEQLIQHLVNKLQEKDRAFMELLRASFEFSQQQMTSIMERNAFLESRHKETEELREEIIRLEADINSDNEDSAKFNRLAGIAEKLLVAQLGNKDGSVT